MVVICNLTARGHYILHPASTNLHRCNYDNKGNLGCFEAQTPLNTLPSDYS